MEVQWMCENNILRTSFQQPRRFSIVSFKDRPRANRGAFLQIGFLISGHRGVAQGGKFFSANSIGQVLNIVCSIPLIKKMTVIFVLKGQHKYKPTKLASTSAYRTGPASHEEISCVPDIGLLKDPLETVQEEMRGLTKAKLEEFRYFLSLVNPEVALLSETHWNSGFAPKFKHHHILKKDRLNRLEGGVAILIHKTLYFTPIHLPTRDTVKAIGASIICTNKKKIDFISTYVPKGDCETEDIAVLLDRANDFVVGGDFNGHHFLWETDANENQAGRTTKRNSSEHRQCLPDNPDEPQHPHRPGHWKSDNDRPDASTTASTTSGPYIGSDHIQIHHP
ncbi:Uncharacterized protein APZ42_032923 [Daphnia magna]|uniref:Endonuclease/exonuclease/phosphatase domain-containing protein n=1 Tax=Daphnia magna TaxID=35525 RepID=A0A164LJP2_9CRUS|nr:Uncharacterized protein APZ42_032923 [Daphnia magna]